MAVSIDNLRVERSGRAILEIPHLNLSDQPTLLLGVNGAGKSTLLKAIAARRPKQRGVVSVSGTVAFVEQEFRPIVGFSALEYCAYVAWLAGQQRKVARRDAAEWLRFTNLASVSDQRCETLSGGEKARLAIATALNSGADILLLDEPSASLDPISKVQIAEVYQRIVDNGQSLLVSTHDAGELRAPFAQVFVLDSGHVVFDGTREGFLSLAHEAGDSAAHVLARSFVQRAVDGHNHLGG